MTVLDTKLLPCPHCGGDAELDTGQAYRALSDGAIGSRAVVYCTRCGADVGFCYEDARGTPREDIVNQVVDDWNRRVSPSQGEGPVADVVERTSNPGERREIQFHLDRLNAWLTELWAANNLTLHMCNGTVRTGLHGLLCDIRDDVMAVRDALASLAPRAAQESPADEQSGETSLAAEPGEAVAECTKFNAVGRKCVGGECDWHRAYIVMESILRESQDRCRKLQAKLDTHPAPSGQAVAVKPLEWQWDAHTSQWWANSVVGQYHAWEITGYAYFRAGAFSTEKAGGTADEAKAAAQADYEKRVLSALAHPHLLPLKEEVERVLAPLAALPIGPEIAEDVDLVLYKNAGRSITVGDVLRARSLLSRIRAGAQEGWRHDCATDGCSKRATVHFERGGVGSYYCHDCYMRIQALAPSPEARGGRS